MMTTCSWPALGCDCPECDAERIAQADDQRRQDFQDWLDYDDEPSYAYGGPNEK